MHDEPLSAQLLPDHRPAHIAAVVLSGFLHHVEFDRAGAPDRLAERMDLGVVVDGEGC